MTIAQPPVLSIDEEKRDFRLGSRRLESVTEVLAENGWIDARWYKPIHSVRGGRVHAYSQYIDEGEDLKATLAIAAADKGCDLGQGFEPYWLDEPELGLDGCVESYRKCRDRHGVEMLDIERRLWHPTMYYTGRPDRRARRKGDEWIIDLKPDAHKPADNFQTAAYDPLFGPYPGGRKRASVHYQRDGSEAVLREHTDYADFSNFAAMLLCTRTRRFHHVASYRDS